MAIATNVEYRNQVKVKPAYIKATTVKEYERQINQMVYRLYGLTDEEIKIVKILIKMNFLISTPEKMIPIR